MKKKTTFSIRDWPEYNSGLIQRVSLTVWISFKTRFEDRVRAWKVEKVFINGQKRAGAESQATSEV